MIKKYNNLLDKELKGEQLPIGDKPKQTVVPPRSLIFKANFDCCNQKIEEVKEHWVADMKERNLRTKIKNKDHATAETEKNSNVKLLKFYH
jgi:hypothetical protein